MSSHRFYAIDASAQIDGMRGLTVAASKLTLTVVVNDIPFVNQVGCSVLLPIARVRVVALGLVRCGRINWSDHITHTHSFVQMKIGHSYQFEIILRSSEF